MHFIIFLYCVFPIIKTKTNKQKKNRQTKQTHLVLSKKAQAINSPLGEVEYYTDYHSLSSTPIYLVVVLKARIESINSCSFWEKHLITTDKKC